MIFNSLFKRSAFQTLTFDNLPKLFNSTNSSVWEQFATDKLKGIVQANIGSRITHNFALISMNAVLVGEFSQHSNSNRILL